MSMQFKSATERLKAHVREVPDFPKKGICFRDITPILNNGQLFRLAINIFAERYRQRNLDKIVGIDARGFILGAALAHHLGVGFVPIRKANKLPAKTHRADYDLEYGKATIEIHADALEPNHRVVIIDDLLATGGTAQAAAGLVQKCQSEVVEIAFLIELAQLEGRLRLKQHAVFSAITF
jgi:adenine phosphoribosyltransferase